MSQRPKACDSLELELQIIVRHPFDLVLGIKLKSSGRKVYKFCTHNLWALSLGPFEAFWFNLPILQVQNPVALSCLIYCLAHKLPVSLNKAFHSGCATHPSLYLHDTFVWLKSQRTVSYLGERGDRVEWEVSSRQSFSVYPSCPRTCSENQDSLKNHRDLPTSAPTTQQQTVSS